MKNCTHSHLAKQLRLNFVFPVQLKKVAIWKIWKSLNVNLLPALQNSNVSNTVIFCIHYIRAELWWAQCRGTEPWQGWAQSRNSSWDSINLTIKVFKILMAFFGFGYAPQCYCCPCCFIFIHTISPWFLRKTAADLLYKYAAFTTLFNLHTHLQTIPIHYVPAACALFCLLALCFTAAF